MCELAELSAWILDLCLWFYDGFDVAGDMARPARTRLPAVSRMADATVSGGRRCGRSGCCSRMRGACWCPR